MIGEYYGQNVDIAGMKNKLLKSYFLLSKIKLFLIETVNIK